MSLLFLRTILLYTAVVFGLRLTGKRQLGELSTCEFAVTILVSELASIPLQDTAVPMFNGMIPLLTLVSLEVLIAALCRTNHRARKIFSGSPCIIIRNGKLDEKMMKDLRLSIEDVLESLRFGGASRIQDVRYAVVETNGQLSIVLKSEAQPVTPSQLGLSVSEVGIPIVLISRGKVIRKNLSMLNKTEDWLIEQCRKKHISSVQDVFLFTLDDSGNQFIQEREKGVSA